MSTPEGKIQTEVCKYLRKKRVFFWRTNNMPTYDPRMGGYRAMGEYALKGVPDILAVGKNGRLIGIEVKSKVGKLSADQFFFADRLANRGGEYHVVRSLADIQELDGLW
jgi:hypothetical protein